MAVILILVLALVFINCGQIFGTNPCVPREYSEGIVCVCNSTYCDTIEESQPASGQYLLFTSSKAGLRLSKTSGNLTTKLTSNEVQCEGANFKVNISKTYQKMHGFGGAFTDAAGINILALSKDAQDNLLRSYFSKDGIKYNIGRVPIGGSDFSARVYTYDDGDPDPNLDKFNLTEEDLEFKIPIINRVQEISAREIQLFASAWSAPTWMKTNHKITGLGFLYKKYYGTWADYHIKFLDEYKKYNISFWAITTGNEPIDAFIGMIVTFNSMGWTPWTHREWIGQHLGPKLRNSHHNNTIIIGLDDQRILLPWWMKLVLQDPEANKYISGIGIHWYVDFLTPPSLLQYTHDDFPDKFLLYTEACEGSRPWSRYLRLGSWDRGEQYMHSIISTINHWVTGWTDWNMALDLEGGPNWNKNFVDSPIIVNSSVDEFYKQPMFYSLAHVSTFIEPGAMRVDIQPQSSNDVEVMAVQNPDKGVVIVLHNMKNKIQEIKLEDMNKGTCIQIQLPEKSFTTLIY